METIKNYLENMFMNVKSTPEVKKAKAELLAMMEDKYQELKAEGKTENEAIGIVISEFGNLEELASELGIEENISGYIPGNEISVSMEAAKQYCADMEKASVKYAVGVLLCICSPILLILMGGLQEEYGFSDGFLAVTGLVPLFILIGIAVTIFIVTGISMSKYECYEKEPLQLDFATEQYLRDRRESNRAGFAIQIAIGVFLCIMASVPVVVVGSMELASDMPSVITVALLLAIVSIAVFLFVTAGVKQDAYHVLLQEEEYSVDRKNKKGPVAVFNTIYWPVVTAVYLGWSFITMDWHITWVVWPVAGVFAAALESIVGCVFSKYFDKME